MPHRSRTTLTTDISPIRTRNDIARSISPVSPIAASEYQRSASYTYLPTAINEHYSRHAVKGSFSEEDLIAVPEQGSPQSSGWTTPEEHEIGLRANRIQAQDLALELQGPRITSGRFPELDGASRTEPRDESVSSAASRSYQRGSVSTNASRKVQRRSWYSIATTPDSRSPSPSKRDVDDEEDFRVETIVPTPRDRRSLLPRPESFQAIDEHDDASTIKTERTARPNTSRGGTLFSKRPLSIFGRNSDGGDEESLPTVPNIPKSFSTDKLSTMGSIRAAIPSRLSPLDRMDAQSIIGGGRKKDELWSVFRSLDADYSKFASKSVALKANVIRSALIPFLRNYHNDPSTYILRPEDLERRTAILNKWWTALIELLHGRNNQSISGTDRPVILDGVAGIMERPEWRLHPSLSPMGRETSSRPSTSQGVAAQDKVQHNVNNIFVQNLRAQMAFVVDKMSLRAASASLVTFCGKACAYAFMFVPGMADVLVRLWDLKSDVFRRVLLENGIDRLANLSRDSDDILSQFPSCLHSLAFTTLPEFNRRLRTPPPLPAGTTNIQWWGYWRERWKGNESELFYVFVKHFHILVSDFLQASSGKEERMRVPGMLLVHSQILSNLDATIHRKHSKNALPEAIAAMQAMDDVFADPDAVASAIPVPPMNAARPMAENRLLVLTRDFLSEQTETYSAARRLFAETFNDLLQATTKGMSVYDASGCYTLLELLEEALVILVRYEQASTGAATLVQPEFWHLMSRRMISSENTLIEIRLYAFLYTVWNTVVCNENRKADLCLGLLLDPVVFASRFNHWSPMVRAYYMRLLCWRVGRYDGDATPGDLEILDTLLDRLQTTWSHFLWQRNECLEVGDVPPQTSPCNPAVYRRLRIIRCETHTGPAAYPSFDVIAPPMPPPGQTRSHMKRNSTISTLSSVAELETRMLAESPDSGSESSSPGVIRGLFRKAIGSKSRSTSQDSGTTTPPTPGSIPIPVHDNRPAFSRSATDDWIPSRSSSLSGTSTPTGPVRSSSFKFAFEYNQNIKPPRPLRLIPPRLPAPAQRCLAAVSDRVDSTLAANQPRGIARKRATYNGRALAEWALVVGECQSFFDRRRHEGIAEDRYVETPTLSVDIFKRAG